MPLKTAGLDGAAASLLLLTLIAPASRAAAPAAAPTAGGDDLASIVRTQEIKAPRIDDVVRSLDLRPGMSVLDVYAGTGQQAYRLAQAVGPEGRVVATDVSARFVDYIASQAKSRGLPQIETRLVAEGLDPFYSSRSYDLIMLWDVFNYLATPVDLYRGLLAGLKPGGRLVLVESEMAWERGFFIEDVKDAAGLAAAVAKEPEGSPYASALVGLRKEMKDGLRPDDPFFARKIVFHLNAALEGRLYRGLSDGPGLRGGLGLTDQERPYASWISHRLALDQVADRQIARIEFQLFKLMQSLNKMLLIQRYRPFLRAPTPDAPYWSSAPEVRWALATDRRTLMMRAAGYELVSKTPLPPFQAVWVFTPVPR